MNDAHSRIREVVANICQRTLDAIELASRILLGKAKNRIDKHLPDSRLTDQLSVVAMVPFPSNQYPAATQDRIRCKPRANFSQTLPAKDFVFNRQTLPLIIVQQDAFVAELSFEYLIFGS